MLQERCVPKLPASPVQARTKLDFSSGPSRKAKHFLSQRGPNYRTKLEPEQTKLGIPEGTPLDEAIHLAQGSDPIAFEYTYRLHCSRVYALCLRFARDPGEAEDLTQKAFLQLFREIHTFRGESAFSSWLCRLTANVAFMSFRKKKLATELLESPTETDDETRSTGHEIGVVHLRLSGLFDRINLQAAIEQLPEGYKANFLLHDGHGYEQHEIAKIFGCQSGTPSHNCTKRTSDSVRSCAAEALAANEPTVDGL